MARLEARLVAARLAQGARAAAGGAGGKLRCAISCPSRCSSLAALGLYLTPADAPMFGLDHARFAQVALAGALALWLLLAGPWRLAARRRRARRRRRGDVGGADDRPHRPLRLSLRIHRSGRSRPGGAEPERAGGRPGRRSHHRPAPGWRIRRRRRRSTTRRPRSCSTPAPRRSSSARRTPSRMGLDTASLDYDVQRHHRQRLGDGGRDAARRALRRADRRPQCSRADRQARRAQREPARHELSRAPARAIRSSAAGSC